MIDSTSKPVTHIRLDPEFYFSLVSDRKLQRTNEELQEQVDSLQIQATHLQTRSLSRHFLIISLVCFPSLFISVFSCR